jgi:hypothetical protein
MPGAFHVLSSDKQVRPYSFVVERIESGDRVALSDILIPIEWSLRWYQWPPVPLLPHRWPPPETWTKVIGGRPLLEEPRSQLAFPWNAKFAPPGVPDTYCATVATATVDLPEGSYLIDAVGAGYRVAIDGQWLLAQTWPDHINRRSIVMNFPRGRHELRVEIYHALGPGLLDFQIRKAPPPPQQGTPP